MLTNADFLALDGKQGDFTARIRLRPRYIDTDSCTACGLCTQYCPRHHVDPYNEGLALTRPIHIDYAQAVPATYYIDPESCLYLQHDTCQICVPVCQSHAINFNQQPEELDLQVGAVILAPGFGRISGKTLTRFGYEEHPDVVTSIEFERMTSASGPFQGEVKCFSDGRHPHRLAFIQCVGSRDLGCDNGYCSSVCCMYAIKEALVVKEHDPDVEITIYYMDIRTQGKDFDKARERAEAMGIKFVRAKVAGVTPWKNRLQLTYSTLDGRHEFEPFDMVVLSVGLESPRDAGGIADITGIELNRYDFAKSDTLSPLTTRREGVIVAGAFQGPKDIPESVTQASAAAGIAAGLLEKQRGQGIVHKSYPREKDIGDEVRIGVFTCHCGINISSVVDVHAVDDSVADMEGVVYHTDSLYSCSQDAIETLKQTIIEHNLNRVVIAACSPRTHEPLFQETLKDAGLNPCLVEMVNIRNQCSWVHAAEPEAATDKSKDLVRMAVAKVRGMQPLPEQTVPVMPKALIVGGGIAGMTAALTLAGQGFDSVILEQGATLGGHLGLLNHTLSGSETAKYLKHLVAQVKKDRKIEVLTSARLAQIAGFIGNFASIVATGTGEAAKEHTVDHGVIILATGGHEHRPDGYLLDKSNKVVTQLELEKRLAGKAKNRAPGSVVMIQCAGSRGDDLNYCSKVCCNHAVKNALQIKEINPDAQVIVLYRDMRTYGFAEDAYREARLKGVVFIPYDLDHKPEVYEKGRSLHVKFFDSILQEETDLTPDLVALSVGIVPDGTNGLSKLLKAPLTDDRFFLEAHVKLRPVELPVDGMYVCGLAHAPKPVDETIAQAQAAAAKAAIPLVKGSVSVDPIVSHVDQDTCIGCGICASLCPFAAIEMVKVGKKRKAHTIAASCKACGICSSHCPTFAISMGGFTNEQIAAQIEAFGEVSEKETTEVS
ncbi:heterodisulfide reductase, subunit A/methylviologen reducing hydrogenase, subunit delta [hydrothermal vent metagenome]|uniref:Heterodisulfide reductase, subunit A/methylviologen reducing hydrogenase, subunit delta n=1 Tax=hydrothermal vent metagenome TaxID=652676 RepID=A0A3B0VKL6_9ZZZZ